MTLATHAVVGGAAASLFPSHPVMAFLVGFSSHFVLDAIPHWDYKILSKFANSDLAMAANAHGSKVSRTLKADRYFIYDLLRIGSDALLGFLIILLAWYPVLDANWKILVLGAIGGILPDFLQFVYMRWPYQPMVALQKFHLYIHARFRLNDRPVIGVLSQMLVIAVTLFAAKYLVGF